MSTRCYIAKQIEDDEYRTIFCHFDGYLEHVGAILLDAYNTPEKLDQLLALGDIDVLGLHLSPDPNLPCDERGRQKDVTVAYARDMGEEMVAAEIKTLSQLEEPEGWIEFVYIFDKDGEWNYLDIHEQYGDFGPNKLKEGLEAEFPDIEPNPTEGYFKAIVNYIRNQDQTSPMAMQYFDKNGNEIKAGMTIRMDDGSLELVYETEDGYGNPDLGINATNADFLKYHPDWEQEFYSLSMFNMEGVEICPMDVSQAEESKEDDSPIMQM